MSYAAKIIADSMSHFGHRLTTFEVCFPRIVLAEFNTHRTFSRNSASSRAIPVRKMLERVKENPFVPASWGKNQKGMQASPEVLTGNDRDEADFAWRELRNHAMNTAARLAFPPDDHAMRGLDVHKQIANRLLEPWLWHTVIVTATEWSNFWNLRDSKMAQPELRTAVAMMHELYDDNVPDELDVCDWHLPYVAKDEGFHVESNEHGGAAITAAKISAGRCARVSYLTHDGKRDQAEDIRLHDSLLTAGHMSPLEHPARPMTSEELKIFQAPELQFRAADASWLHTGKFTFFLGNVQGWVQYRKLVPGEADIHTHRGTSA
jgi:thymidylate synthase ThyX